MVDVILYLLIIYCYKNIDKIVHVNLPEVLYADYILIKQLGIIKDNEIIFISCEEDEQSIRK